MVKKKTTAKKGTADNPINVSVRRKGLVKSVVNIKQKNKHIKINLAGKKKPK